MFKKNNPFGLWHFQKDDEFMTARFFKRQKSMFEDKFEHLLTGNIDNEVSTRHAAIDLCLYEGKTFLKLDYDYFEYYVEENANKLFLSNSPYSLESYYQADFLEHKKAKVVPVN